MRPAADPKVALYQELTLQLRRLLRGPDAARHLEQLLDLAERLDAGHASHRPRR